MEPAVTIGTSEIRRHTCPHFPSAPSHKDATRKVETVRYYERIGLMPSPARTNGGHRVYDEAHLKQLYFIRPAREPGFPFGRIQELLSLSSSDETSCEVASDIALGHLADVRQKISNLRALEATLENLLEACAERSDPACPIIDTLYESPNSLVTPLGRK